MENQIYVFYYIIFNINFSMNWFYVCLIKQDNINEKIRVVFSIWLEFEVVYIYCIYIVYVILYEFYIYLYFMGNI